MKNEERVYVLTLGPWTAWASGNLQKEPDKKKRKGCEHEEQLLPQHAGLVATSSRELTWGFMFGPGIPMAAICSMLGAPRPPNGVPPIWGNRQTLSDFCRTNLTVFNSTFSSGIKCLNPTWTSAIMLLYIRLLLQLWLKLMSNSGSPDKTDSCDQSPQPWGPTADMFVKTLTCCASIKHSARYPSSGLTQLKATAARSKHNTSFNFLTVARGLGVGRRPPPGIIPATALAGASSDIALDSSGMTPGEKQDFSTGFTPTMINTETRLADKPPQSN